VVCAVIDGVFTKRQPEQSAPSPFFQFIGSLTDYKLTEKR